MLDVDVRERSARRPADQTPSRARTASPMRDRLAPVSIPTGPESRSGLSVPRVVRSTAPPTGSGSASGTMVGTSGTARRVRYAHTGQDTELCASLESTTTRTAGPEAGV